MSTINQLVTSLASSHRFFNTQLGFKEVKLSPYERTFSEAEEAKMSKVWEDLKKVGKVSHSNPLIAVNTNSLVINGEILNLEVYPADFRHYRSTLDDNSTRVWALGVSALTRINYNGDSYYIFGERNGKNLNTGGLLENLPGGFMEPIHLDERNPVLAAFQQELYEEVGFKEFEKLSVKPFYLSQLREDFRAGGRKYQDVCLELLADVQGIKPIDFVSNFTKREHTKLHIVCAENLPIFVSDNFDRFTIRTRHTLQLYLKQNY